jgi:hypothetical protein
MNIEEILLEDMSLVLLFYDRIQWEALINTLVKHRIP